MFTYARLGQPPLLRACVFVVYLKNWPAVKAPIKKYACQKLRLGLQRKRRNSVYEMQMKLAKITK